MRNGLVGELRQAVSRLAMVGVVGGLAGACSADTMRFSENPFSNPFKTAGAEEPRTTGSIDASRSIAPMPTGTVTSAPLRSASAAPSYNAPPAPAQAPAASARYASGNGPGWSATGGTPITVAQGDSLTAISTRYGVPSAAILSANGLSAGDVAPGRQLVIPVYSATGGSRSAAPSRVAAAPAQVAARPVPVATPAPVPAAPGRLVSRSPMPERRAEPVRAAAAAAPARRLEEPRRVASAEPVLAAPTGHPRPGRTAAVPAPQPVAARVAAKAEPAKPEPVKVAAAAPAKVAKVEPPKVEAAKPVKAPEPVKVAAVAPAKAAETAKPAAREPETTSALPTQTAAVAAPAASSADFRWPARGRVISGFGASGTNEGINIAVPDGTPVKAAEAGTVAYAGNEVKGYGNLVLIRHDNGYVSAYAHNGDIDVKRGQKVTRGQIIAKSGQTGNVTSPQLHFELRKGATPVDPMPYLTASN